MNKTPLGIAVLTVSAVALVLANLALKPAPVMAAEAVMGRDYQCVTARAQAGGEALYVLDNKTGQLAVFAYDPRTRDVRLRDVRFVAEAFQ
jgi:hypothetical protein